MKFSKIFLISLLLALLTACGAPMAPGGRLVENAIPVQSMTIEVFAGDLEQFESLSAPEIAAYRDGYVPSFGTRFSEVFKANGLVVPATQIHRGSPPSLLSLPGNTSHLLIVYLSGVSYSTRGGFKAGYPEAIFKARLVELSTKTVVWSGTPSMPIRPKQPNLSIEYLAGSVINGLNQAKFIKLKRKDAVSARGDPIQRALFIQEDK